VVVTYFKILSQRSSEGLDKVLKNPESKYSPSRDSKRRLSECKTGVLPFEPPLCVPGSEYTWVNMLAIRHGVNTDRQSFKSDKNILLRTTLPSIQLA
jgi:hypothetical protein